LGSQSKLPIRVAAHSAAKWSTSRNATRSHQARRERAGEVAVSSAHGNGHALEAGGCEAVAVTLAVYRRSRR
jgi:hypothetical protein